MCKLGPESDGRLGARRVDWAHNIKPTSTLTSDMCSVFTHSVVNSFYPFIYTFYTVVILGLCAIFYKVHSCNFLISTQVIFGIKHSQFFSKIVLV